MATKGLENAAVAVAAAVISTTPKAGASALWGAELTYHAVMAATAVTLVSGKLFWTLLTRFGYKLSKLIGNPELALPKELEVNLYGSKTDNIEDTERVVNIIRGL